MKNYSPFDFENRWGTHTVRATIQCDDYRGTITTSVDGNCKGLQIIQDMTESLDCMGDMDVDDYPYKFTSDCEFRLSCDSEGELWFFCALKNDGGDTLEIEQELSDLSRYIVSIEIIDFQPEAPHA